MPQHLTLSRAARLVGVSRGELQKRIRAGDLATFEGKVDVEDLLRTYPAADMDSNPILERMERIKAEAMPKSWREVKAPSSRVLLARLKALSEVLTETKAELDRYRQLTESSVERLGALLEMDEKGLPKGVDALLEWLLEELEKAPPTPDSTARIFAKDVYLRIMAATVKMIPSGHEFLVEGANTILEASIRAGLHVTYGCTGGNCGSCKARLVSGEVWKTRHHDYVLSEQEKQAGYLLMCCNTPITDLVIEAPEARSVRDLPHQDVRATVKKRERLAEDVVMLHVQTPRTQTLRFMAGQKARLALSDEIASVLPLSSCPCDGRNLQFIVRRRAGDAFAETVFGDSPVGQVVTVTGPEGDFVLDDEATSPVLFIAFDDGFAPIRSLIEHAVSIDRSESIHLVWMASRPNGHYLARQCRAWADALDNFSYVPLSREWDSSSGIEGLPDFALYDAYVAGPTAQVAAAREWLLRQGLPEARLRTDAYE